MPIVEPRTGTGEARALDLHEGIAPHPDPRAGVCPRWPEGWLLVNTLTGEGFCGLCRATNLCPYCRMRYVVETVEMVTLDACEDAPTLYVVLTAREHLTKAECRFHLNHLLRSLRKRWPVEWFTTTEFQRRGALHLNLAVKGVPPEDVSAFEGALVPLWCSRVDALPSGQYVAPMQDAGGAISYMAKMLAHGLKQEQAPPLGWRGHRTSQTRGYLVRPAAVMREEARDSLKLKRLLWKGYDLEAAELELAAAKSVAWTMRRVNPSTVDLKGGVRV